MNVVPQTMAKLTSAYRIFRIAENNVSAFYDSSSVMIA
jgi:hypothetical protein